MESEETDQMLKKADFTSPDASPMIAPKYSGSTTGHNSTVGEPTGFRGRLSNCWRRMPKCHVKRESALLIVTVSAVIIGVALGLGIRARGADGDKPIMTRRQLVYLKFPGELFLRMLQMLILPLIVSSIISSLAQVNTQTAGRLGAFTMAYYTATTVLAVVEGIILVQIINPGRWSEGWKPTDIEQEPPCLSTAVDTILDLIRYVTILQ